MTDKINGAQALIRTLVDSGVEVCFSNPGTSEMHFVAALDDVPEMRGVLNLFEGVATGAADGYARMAGKPAAVLLHLGPGLGNGLANLHNARRAWSPVVNVVGDHALAHKLLDAPLESDIVAVATNVSSWIRTAQETSDVGQDAADCVAAAIGAPGQVATLILPADVSWGEGGQVAAPVTPAGRTEVDPDRIAAIAEVLRSDATSRLLLGGVVPASEDGLRAAARIAAATSADVMIECFPTRLRRGAGLPAFGRVGYLSEIAVDQFKDVENLITVDAKVPVSFFAYPDKASTLVPDTCVRHALADHDEDGVAALIALADALDAPTDIPVQEADAGTLPEGVLDGASAAQVIGMLIPAEAIVVDEAITSSLMLPFTTAGSPAHDLLTLTGGAIGYGLPTAVGAAIACPDRKVLALQADGSAMYTIQSLWSMARENLDVTVVIYNNASYEILKMELQRVGAEGGTGEASQSLLDLGGPVLDFTAIAEGMGMTATRATTIGEFHFQLQTALATTGPTLVEAIIPKMF